MPESVERRRAPRVALVGRPGARTQEGLPVWLANLSTTGARLLHIEPFPTGTVLTLQLPPELDDLRLTTQVAWTASYGSEQTSKGEQHTVYHSGVAFMQVAPAQRVALERLVERFRQERASSTG